MRISLKNARNILNHGNINYSTSSRAGVLDKRIKVAKEFAGKY
jgi:hypothetical protein